MRFKLLIEGTDYEALAAKIISNSGLYDYETSLRIINALEREDIHAFTHAPNWLRKYLKGIARMLVEYANGNTNKAHEFLENCPNTFEQYLTYIKDVRDETNAQKLDDNFVNKMSFDDVKKELDEIQKERDTKFDSELQKMNFEKVSNYQLIPIDSYTEFNSKFGGNITGDGTSSGDTHGNTWCHANEEFVYNNWVGNGQNTFFVLARKDWQSIHFDAESNRRNPKDAYGNSLIAILVEVNTGKLLRATLRCNHIGVSANADNQYKTYAELSQIAGFNVQEKVNEYLKDAIERYNKKQKEMYLQFGLSEDGTLIYNGQEISSDIKPIIKHLIIQDISKIDDMQFCDFSEVTSIIIGNSVTSIGGWAFRDCHNLTSVVIGNSVKSIGNYAFARCNNLTNVVIPDSVINIGESAFYNCHSLTNVVIPDNVTSIGWFAFYGCRSLTNVVIPDNVASIGRGTFYNCISLTSVVIPDSVKSIGDGAFDDCRSLTNVVISDNVASIGRDAFYNCSSLTSVVIPDSVKSIGWFAFEESTTILCSNKSYAHKWANQMGVPYKLIDANESYKRRYN